MKKNKLYLKHIILFLVVNIFPVINNLLYGDFHSLLYTLKFSIIQYTLILALVYIILKLQNYKIGNLLIMFLAVLPTIYAIKILCMSSTDDAFKNAIVIFIVDLIAIISYVIIYTFRKNKIYFFKGLLVYLFQNLLVFLMMVYLLNNTDMQFTNTLVVSILSLFLLNFIDKL